MRFAGPFGAGVELGALLTGLPKDSVIAPILTQGVPVALGIETVIGAREFSPIRILRTEEGVNVLGCDQEIRLEDRLVIVVDHGVETGTTAKACGMWLREQGVTRVMLAVPVCPKTAANALQFLFESIVSLVAPLGPQSLSWHFESLDVMDIDTAMAMLSTRDEKLDQ